MANEIDFTKYKKIKTVYFELSSRTGTKANKDADFNIDDYPEFDEVVEIKTSFNTATEYRSLMVTIGKK